MLNVLNKARLLAVTTGNSLLGVDNSFSMLMNTKDILIDQS